MILAIDVGNTSTQLALLNEENGYLLSTHRYSSKTEKTVEYHKNNIALFTENQVVSGIVISSVVPEISTFLETACRDLFDMNPIFVSAEIKTGLNIKYDNPQKLGADLIAVAVGAVCEYGAPAIVVDVGTATTFSVISAEKEYLGGLIAPGPVTSMKALASMTAQLPVTRLEVTDKVIGSNTADCINIGTVTAHAAMIDGMIERTAQALHLPSVNVIATGGFSKDLVPLCTHKMHYDENLIVMGLYHIYKMNS